MVMFPGRGGGKKCAKAFGVLPQQWSPWETGMRTPDEMRMKLLAEFFGVSVDYLRTDHDHQENSTETRRDVSRETAGGHPKRGAASIYHSGCPFYRAPHADKPFAGEMRDLCWLAERFFDDLREYGLRVRLQPADVDLIIERFLAYKSEAATTVMEEEQIRG